MIGLLAVLVCRKLYAWAMAPRPVSQAPPTEQSTDQPQLSPIEAEFILSLNNKNPLLWVRIGNQLLSSDGGDTTMLLFNKEYSAADCAIEAVVAHTRYPEAWLLLGKSLYTANAESESEEIRRKRTATVNQIVYNAQKCFEVALGISNVEEAWWHLAHIALNEEKENDSVNVTIKKRKITVSWCVRRALVYSAAWAEGWRYLAEHWIEGEKHLGPPRVTSIRDCIAVALSFPENAQCTSLWRQLGTLLYYAESTGNECPVYQIGHSQVNATQAIIEALRLEPEKPDLWNQLATVLTDDPRISGCLRQARQGCYEQALKLDPGDGVAWNQLGCDLTAREILVLDGALYTQKDCFVKALTHLPQNQRRVAWKNLGAVLQAEETGRKFRIGRGGVEVEGVRYTWEECAANGK